jgi:hypothetical protein
VLLLLTVSPTIFANVNNPLSGIYTMVKIAKVMALKNIENIYI